LLELQNLLELGIDEASLRLYQLFTLLGRRVKEARIDLADEDEK
jgi:hypothetical protein